MSGSSLQAVLGSVVTPEGVIDDGAVAYQDGTITWAGNRREAPPEVARVLPQSPSASFVLPGLVDVHNHGGGGESFPDAETPEQALVAAREHLKHGTTSLVASLVTADADTLASRTAVLRELCESGDLAGIHLEGPFLAKSRCGAQNPAFMQVPSPELVRRIAEVAGGYFATMTIAPEIEGNAGPGSVIDALAEVGAIPSFGHTDCTAEEMTAAIGQAVADLASSPRSHLPTATHLFNGMRPIHHRDPGPAMASLAAAGRGEMIVELISDGTHLAGETTSAVFDLVGRDAITFVTDAMAAAGMPDGEYILGPVKVRVAQGVARLADGDSIAGGTAHLLDVVRCATQAGVPLADAVYCASVVPARILGIGGKTGALAAGLSADILLADAGLRPVQVIRRGEVAV